MLIGAIILTALALIAVLIFWRQGHVDPADFDRRAREKEGKPAGDAPAQRARPPGAPRNRETRQNVRSASKPDRDLPRDEHD